MNEICVYCGGTRSNGQRLVATPDSIFVNGKVVTVDADFTIHQAFAVHGDRFVAVGTNERIRAFAGKSTRVIDLRGRVY